MNGPIIGVIFIILGIACVIFYKPLAKSMFDAWKSINIQLSDIQDKTNKFLIILFGLGLFLVGILTLTNIIG